MSDSQNNFCICCKHTKNEPHLEILYRCCRCGHVWADMTMEPDELAALYSEHYFKGEEYLDYEREEPALRKNFRKVLKMLAPLIPENASIWEIGAAYGYFLDEASSQYQVAGCDISREAAARAAERFGLDVQCIDYLQKPPGNGYDAICLWDTIEHLAKPHLFLSKAHEELKPGGILALSTGDIGAWPARIRGKNWRLIHPPTHLHYFTVRSMTTLLEGVGFDVISVKHRTFWRTADAVAFKLLYFEKPASVQAIYRALKKMGFLKFSFPVNTFDLMTVIAKKQS